jgi:hypothetical protein
MRWPHTTINFWRHIRAQIFTTVARLYAERKRMLAPRTPECFLSRVLPVLMDRAPRGSEPYAEVLLTSTRIWFPGSCALFRSFAVARNWRSGACRGKCCAFHLVDGYDAGIRSVQLRRRTSGAIRGSADEAIRRQTSRRMP